MQQAIGTSLTKDMQDFCRDNYKILLKVRKDVNPLPINPYIKCHFD